MVTAHQLFFGLKLCSALGCGLIAGVFFGFSTFIMKALAQRPPAEGIAAMQAINMTVINPGFMAAFLGTAAACIFLAISALSKWQQPGAVFLLVGSLLYLGGTVLVTIGCNVPLNEALAIVEPTSAEGRNLWVKYLADWTIWNHVRTIAALAAAAALTLGFCQQPG